MFCCFFLCWRAFAFSAPVEHDLFDSLCLLLFPYLSVLWNEERTLATSEALHRIMIGATTFRTLRILSPSFPYDLLLSSRLQNPHCNSYPLTNLLVHTHTTHTHFAFPSLSLRYSALLLHFPLNQYHYRTHIQPRLRGGVHCRRCSPLAPRHPHNLHLLLLRRSLGVLRRGRGRGRTSL